MSTFLFEHLVNGPIHSRRLGKSLGVNLLPRDVKHCNYNCIYCECGWNTHGKRPVLPTREDVIAALETRLQELQASDNLPDSITFAGNGEPTIHPAFAAIVDDVVALRNHYAPSCKVSTLTNATMLAHQQIAEALMKTDNPILKLDSADDADIAFINQPEGLTVKASELIKCMKAFNGRCIVQTMFVDGRYNGLTVDTMTPAKLDAWEKAIAEIRPRQVHIYTIDRDTAASGLKKVSVERLKEIAQRVERLGIESVLAF